MNNSKHETDWETAFYLCKLLSLDSSDMVNIRLREPQIANSVKDALALFQLNENEQRKSVLRPGEIRNGKGTMCSLQ
jgi:hypothetical protein